jgi:SPP1 family predicted phage head-tail adaptor
VTIEEKSVVRDAIGGETITWSEYDVVWGSVEPLRGREFAEAERAGAEVTTRIVIRFRSGVVPEMRATEGGNTYDVLSVVNVEKRDREMELLCREVLG